MLVYGVLSLLTLEQQGVVNNPKTRLKQPDEAFLLYIYS